MEDWVIVILHTRPQSILKEAFEATFPKGNVASLFRPGIFDHRWTPTGPEMRDWFRRRVFDPGIWRHKVLTIYETGRYHHFTYGLTYLASRQRSLFAPAHRNWTYFHFDNHRDDYDFTSRRKNGFSTHLHFGNFVDSIAYDHGAIPFLVGPDIYPDHDAFGYEIKGTHIPIYSNYFTGVRQRSWRTSDDVWEAATEREMRPKPGYGSLFRGDEMPSEEDLQATPGHAYLSFDLDVLAPSEMVTHFDQNPNMTVRRLCDITSKVQSHKKIFGADILGLPFEHPHPLSILSMIILAKQVVGMDTAPLLKLHDVVKRRQNYLLRSDPKLFKKRNRSSPISKSELLEMLNPQ